MFSKNCALTFLSAILTVVFLSCDSDSPVQTLDDITVSGSSVSECGGFNTIGKISDNGSSFDIDPITYCEAERLYWTYESSTGTLKFMNTRVVLNCCGEHAITAATVNGVVVISEDDQPVNGTDRCLCMCVYDFAIDISGIDAGVIPARLQLTVDNETVTKWEGSINLSDGDGIVITDDEPTIWCSAGNTLTVKKSIVSECGGFDGAGEVESDTGLFKRSAAMASDTETLTWTYDPETNTLQLLNARVNLNCCGDHDISAVQENGVIIVREKDQPENGISRCRCMCDYDFYIEITGLSPGVIPLHLDMTVDYTTVTKWTGSIDLENMAGEIIIAYDK
ncbi:MAG: hypothetical protein JXB48_21525 [Candidatus Latescibacteria bacterium]|nr:hypothetical protein [Candidatus Latescibacterota bacterium]